MTMLLFVSMFDICKLLLLNSHVRYPVVHSLYKKAKDLIAKALQFLSPMLQLYLIFLKK